MPPKFTRGVGQRAAAADRPELPADTASEREQLAMAGSAESVH
jgi:hypothetical protein